MVVSPDEQATPDGKKKERNIAGREGEFKKGEMQFIGNFCVFIPANQGGERGEQAGQVSGRWLVHRYRFVPLCPQLPSPPLTMSDQLPGSVVHQQPHLNSHPAYLLDIAPHSEPASELDADAEADEDMAFAGTPSPYPPPSHNSVHNVQRNGDKIDLQAVDPVLYGLRRSVRLSFEALTACGTADDSFSYVLPFSARVGRVEVAIP